MFDNFITDAGVKFLIEAMKKNLKILKLEVDNGMCLCVLFCVCLYAWKLTLLKQGDESEKNRIDDKHLVEEIGQYLQRNIKIYESAESGTYKRYSNSLKHRKEDFQVKKEEFDLV